MQDTAAKALQRERRAQWSGLPRADPPGHCISATQELRIVFFISSLERERERKLKDIGDFPPSSTPLNMLTYLLLGVGQRSEANFQESVLSFYHVGSRDQTLILSLGGGTFTTCRSHTCDPQDPPASVSPALRFQVRGLNSQPHACTANPRPTEAI